MSENDAAPVSHQKQPHQNATNAIEIEQNAAKSTKLIDILPLITVWLQVRVLPGPPVFAREASEAAAPEPNGAKAGLLLQAVQVAVAPLLFDRDAAS
jgi:hypothetical protein